MAFPSNPTEQALQVLVDDPEQINEFLSTLVAGPLWVPLPDGAGNQPDGSFALPTLLFEEQQFIPGFTSEEQLKVGAPDADEHVMLPAVEMIQQCPDNVGLAINPGGDAGFPIPPDGVRAIAKDLADMDGTQVTIDHPQVEPTELLAALGTAFAEVPPVVSASRAWIEVQDQGEGLIIGIELDDPTDQQSQQLALQAVETTVKAQEPEFSLDVTFTDQQEDDPVDEWLLDNTDPFYTRG